MTRPTFSALYYPFSKCFDSYSLKRALLYYEEIHFMDPFTIEQQENLLETSHYYYGLSQTTRIDLRKFLREVYSYLEDQGVIVNSDIYPLIKQHDSVLTSNTIEDVSDELFLKYSFMDCHKNDEKVSWHILENRMPPSLISKMNSGDWQTFRDQIAKSALTFTDFDDGETISFVHEFQRNKTQRQALRSEPRYSDTFVTIDSVPKEEGRFSYGHTALPVAGYVIPYAYGASISITQAMLYAELNNLALFTDSLTMHDLLARKCQLAYERVGQRASELKWRESLSRNMKANEVFVTAIDAAIPREDLDRLDFLQILKLRKASASQLQDFRAYLAELNSIRVAPWEKGYFEEIAQLAARINGEVLALQKSISETYEKLFRSTLHVLAGVGVGIAVMPHNLALGSVLALLAAKDLPLDPIFRLWESKADSRHHSLSYLLSIKKQLDHTSSSPAIEETRLFCRRCGAAYKTAPCSFCGAPLRTNYAKQCRFCKRDWHDPNNVTLLEE